MPYRFEPSGKLKLPTDGELAAADADTVAILLNQGTLADGSPYWAYIAVKPSRYKAFMDATAAQQPIRLNEYGPILRYGFEVEVPSAVREEMKREYGCRDDYIALVAHEIEQAQKTFLDQQEAQRIEEIVAMLKRDQHG